MPGVKMMRLIVGKKCKIFVRGQDNFGNTRTTGGDNVEGVLVGPNGQRGLVSTKDHGDGSYLLEFTCMQQGVWTLRTRFNGRLQYGTSQAHCIVRPAYGSRCSDSDAQAPVQMWCLHGLASCRRTTRRWTYSYRCRGVQRASHFSGRPLHWCPARHQAGYDCRHSAHQLARSW